MTADDEDRRHWSTVAEQWLAWARTPDHDAFWAYRCALLEFVGRGAGQALDLGCGEGRISRALGECGYRVTAVDPVAAMIRAAAGADSAAAYAIAGAAALPFADASFDLVSAYNVLMDVADVAAAVREIGRVLRPSGRVVISVVHPFADHGRFAGAEPDAPFVIKGSYFGRQRIDAVEQRNGLHMHFAGWTVPLETYVSAMEAAGLAITALREPVPDLAPCRSHMLRWTRIPLFLWLKARKLPG